MTEPLWLTLARREINTAEISGRKHNARVVAYADRAGIKNISDDETPWCATFLGAMLSDAGLKPSGSALARSYSLFGEEVKLPLLLGTIIVLSSPGRPSWTGHVGFATALTRTHVRLIGGNQGNRVSEDWFPRMNGKESRIVAMRWPQGISRAGVPRLVEQATRVAGSGPSDR